MARPSSEPRPRIRRAPGSLESSPRGAHFAVNMCCLRIRDSAFVRGNPLFTTSSVRPQRNCNPAFDGPFTYARWTASYQSSSSSDAIFRCGRARTALHDRPADLFELMTGHLHLTGHFQL